MNCQEANQVQFYVNLNEILNDEKAKDSILKQILPAIHALLNTDGGGILKLRITSQGSEAENKFIRMIEQQLLRSIATQRLTSHITFGPSRDGKIYCRIKESDILVTANYFIYVPSKTQANKIPSTEEIDTILKRQHVPQPVLIGSHHKVFTIDTNCGFSENKNTEFKYLTASPSKRTTLADRMTGKGNKLTCYVSAFANHSGGHIYYGITDNGLVKGEFSPNEKDKGRIIKKVEKVINKMIWPEQIGQPKRGQQWEIFFEPVLDENSIPVPSTFVIVINIAPCLGGVFTEEPECYEMVDGQVSKMSFSAWKERILKPVCSRSKEEIPNSVARVTWSSPATQKALTAVNEKLRELINDGEWDAISRLSTILQTQSHSNEMKLAVLSKQAIACYRRGHFNHAHFLLNQYLAIVPHVDDVFIFEMVGFHIEAGLKRATGDFKGLKEALTAALSKAEMIVPCLVTTTVYTFAATVSDLISFEEPTNNKVSSEVFSIRALEHSQHVEDCSRFYVDKTQKAHITLATFYLGCNLSGQSLTGNIATSDLDKAKHSLMTVYQSICEGNLLSNYREIQFKLVQCIYYYRHSQVTRERRDYFLQNAFNHAKMAECLARDHQFKEMVEWSQANKALCTEELVRANLASILGVKMWTLLSSSGRNCLIGVRN